MQHRELRWDELFSFIDDELNSFNDLDEFEKGVLSSSKTAQHLNLAIGAFSKSGELCGFCLVPSYNFTIATSLYIARKQRNKGYAKHLLNHLKITVLNCLNDNKPAIALYEKLNFRKVYASSHSIRFERSFDV